MLRIELYTEISCPWCLVGQHRLDKVLAERFPKLNADIHHHPVLLLPDAPSSDQLSPTRPRPLTRSFKPRQDAQKEVTQTPHL